MDDQIVCPHCKQTIPLTEAILHKLKGQFSERFEEEKKKLVVLYQKRLREETDKITKEQEETVRRKITKEIELRLQDSKNEQEELQKQNESFQKQLLETTKLIRQLKNENELKQLEMEKKLINEEEKIREKEKHRIEDEYLLKMKEKDKKLQDAIRETNELRRKLEQGSQQLQGEVFELELETLLTKEFPFDDIRPVPKGVHGADIIQKVRNDRGVDCGIIVWEMKRTKAWSADWTVKLKDDKRTVKADIAVLISQVLPSGMRHAGLLDGVWVGTYDALLSLAYALRTQLLEVAAVRSASVGKNQKMETLYAYLSGSEFRNRVEAIIEAFTAIQSDIEKEKRWFANKWAKQEKHLRKVIDHTLGMHGELESMMGKELEGLKVVNTLPSGPDQNEGLF